MHIMDVEGLQQLFDNLREQGYSLIGPTVRDGAIVFNAIASVGDLPAGWTDVQGAATYALQKRSDGALFGFAIGPVSWKKFLFPPKVKLFTAVRSGKSFQVTPGNGEEGQAARKVAFIGIRSCELNALRIQDRVFMGPDFRDPAYSAIRERTFLVSVNCGKPGGNCFCASLGTGPRASEGFDLALTELTGPGGHRFAVEVGSQRGQQVFDRISHREATEEDCRQTEELLTSSAKSMGRQVDREGVKQILLDAFDHPEWDEVAKRCLTCANCTMVCPTCFCSTVEDSTDLTGTRAERLRRWDSCLTMDFARVAGGNIRPSAKARYRQWVMHKFAYWIDQFGVDGCVGCGRCITWCPVGIDITEELEAIRRTAVAAPAADER